MFDMLCDILLVILIVFAGAGTVLAIVNWVILTLGNWRDYKQGIYQVKD